MSTTYAGECRCCAPAGVNQPGQSAPGPDRSRMNVAGFEMHIVGKAMGNVLLFLLCSDWAVAVLGVVYLQLRIGSERGLMTNWVNGTGE